MSTLVTLSFKDWVNIVGVIGGLIALIAACVNHLNNQKADTDRKIAEMVRRTDEIVRRTDEIEGTLVEIKTELKNTTDLLNADLSWRYLYQNDPTRKNLVPRYQPDTRTLEFVDTTTQK